MKTIKFEATLYDFTGVDLIDEATLVRQLLYYGDRHQEAYFGEPEIISIEEVADDTDSEN